MADSAQIITLPTHSQRTSVASIAPAPVVEHPGRNAGTYGFPAPEAMTVTQDGGRVLIEGVRARTFNTPSNAARSAGALRTLAELGWPIDRLIDPTPPLPAA